MAVSGAGVAPAIAYLEDPTGQLTAEQVAAPEMAPRFTPAQRHDFYLGWTDSAYWFRFTLPPGSAGVLVRVGSAYNDFLDFFRPRADGGFAATRAGDHRPFIAQEFDYRFPVFRMTPSPDRETHFYLRANCATPLQLPLQFLSEAEFDSTRMSDNLRFGMYFGLILAMALYNLFLYVGIRDRAYLFYALWITSYSYGMAVHNGLVLQWLLREAPQIADYAVFPVVVSIAMLPSFTRAVLGLHQRAPRLDALARGVAWSVWVVIAVVLIGGIRAGYVVLDLYALAALFASAVPTVLVWRQGYRPAAYLVLAMGLLWLCGVFVLVYHLGLISGFESFAFFLTHDGTLLASALEVILFAFALADRINLLKEEKAAAQAAALESQTRSLATSRRNEQELESRISERTEALTAAHDAAQQANLAKTRFLAAASHDLRQPMHAIGLLVAALRDQLDGRGAQRVAQQIEDAVAALDGLFNALLDISRLDAGAVTPRPAPLALQSLFNHVESTFAPAASAKALRLTVRPTTALVQTDAVLLDRILGNLVANALRYTDTGSVLVAARRRGKAVRIEVRDSGRGIPPEQHAAAFEEFVQLNNPAHDRTQGLGLGLSIVRRLADLLNHPLSLASQPGCGSVFAVTVPYLGPTSPAATPSVSAPRADLRGCFIVVIDDEESILEGMRALLAQAGAHVLTARSGPAAVAALAEHLRPPDLVVSDFHLGGGESGLEAIRRIRENQSADLPALLITGDAAAAELAVVKASGLPILVKPVAAARLRAAIAEALGRVRV